ncbi:hypothetical protein NW765_015210 [Fusarium oxysporum]|nr:hypothetical protein NW765_015210 [Fusarium oxysporum]
MQQLRGCNTGIKCSPAAAQIYTPAPAPRSKAGEMTIEERKVVALEAIDETARLWVVKAQLPQQGKQDRREERL